MARTKSNKAKNRKQPKFIADAQLVATVIRPDLDSNDNLFLTIVTHSQDNFRTYNPNRMEALKIAQAIVLGITGVIPEDEDVDNAVQWAERLLQEGFDGAGLVDIVRDRLIEETVIEDELFHKVLVAATIGESMLSHTGEYVKRIPDYVINNLSETYDQLTLTSTDMMSSAIEQLINVLQFTLI